jgi:hypothetical protein
MNMADAEVRDMSPPPEMTATADELPDKPFGPVAAVFLAAGFGSLVLGILTTWAEASESFAKKLDWHNPVGPLSGKTIVSAGAFFVAWGILGVLWRGKDPSPRTVYLLTGLMVILGIVGTFPTFFELFAPDQNRRRLRRSRVRVPRPRHPDDVGRGPARALPRSSTSTTSWPLSGKTIVSAGALAAAVGEIDDEGSTPLERDIVAGWRSFVKDGPWPPRSTSS